MNFGIARSTNTKIRSTIFYVGNKVDCMMFFERKIQGSASAGSYISLEEVILNKSLTCRKANITA